MNKKEREIAATIMGNWMISIDKLDRDSAEYQQESKLFSDYKARVKKLFEMKFDLCLVSDYQKDVLRPYQEIVQKAVEIWMDWKNSMAA